MLESERLDSLREARPNSNSQGATCRVILSSGIARAHQSLLAKMLQTSTTTAQHRLISPSQHRFSHGKAPMMAIRRCDKP
jgi:hypothetical protein